MKLQEQINRINEMMGILSEDKKIEHYQKLIDFCLDILRDRCDKSDGRLGCACDLLGLSAKVTITNLKKYHDQLVIEVVVTYKSYFNIDEDECVEELIDEDLREELSHYINNTFMIHVEGIENLISFKERNW